MRLKIDKMILRKKIKIGRNSFEINEELELV